MLRAVWVGHPLNLGPRDRRAGDMFARFLSAPTKGAAFVPLTVGATLAILATSTPAQSAEPLVDQPAGVARQQAQQGPERGRNEDADDAHEQRGPGAIEN